MVKLDRGIFSEWTEGRPIWSPFLPFLKKLFFISSKFLIFCGHGLGGLWFFPGPEFSWLWSELFLFYLFYSCVDVLNWGEPERTPILVNQMPISVRLYVRVHGSYTANISIPTI